MSVPLLRPDGAAGRSEETVLMMEKPWLFTPIQEEDSAPAEITETKG